MDGHLLYLTVPTGRQCHRGTTIVAPGLIPKTPKLSQHEKRFGCPWTKFTSKAGRGGPGPPVQHVPTGVAGHARGRGFRYGRRADVARGLPPRGEDGPASASAPRRPTEDKRSSLRGCWDCAIPFAAFQQLKLTSLVLFQKFLELTPVIH